MNSLINNGPPPPLVVHPFSRLGRDRIDKNIIINIMKPSTLDKGRGGECWGLLGNCRFKNLPDRTFLS